MIGFRRSLSRPARRSALAIGCACLAAAMLGTGWMASAQDQSAAKVEDVIVARKTMMDTLSDNMDQIEQMISTNKIDLNDAHEHADTISVMLMAFPHLFPPASNQWKPGVDIDPVTGTYASPDVWSKFPEFYKRAADASKTAYDMSRADKVDELKSKTAELRTSCNACHAAYLKTQ
ncbi:MAG TPA: cytochrome c [Xanthobacteraceae bacterium]|jgi:cytochrome c556